jgi:hypothetical protein
VDFYGTDAQGQRIAATKMNQPQMLAPSVLPSNTSAAPPSAVPTAQFVITVGAVTVHVANNDPAGLDFKSIYGCHGVIVGQGISLSS